MIRFRRATLEDATLLLRWRNEPLSRQASLESREIDEAEHVDWLSKTLLEPTRELLIAVEGERDVGTVRVDEMGGRCRLSWSIAPEARGRGTGTKMVKQLVVRLRRAAPCVLEAKVKSTNLASARIAERVGMQRVSEANGVCLYELRLGG